MIANEMLLSWPELAKLTADEICAHPAWRIVCEWHDEPCVMRRAAMKPRDIAALALRLGGKNCFFGLSNKEAFPDLHELWDVKRNLPDNLLLALVEKECGELFQILENAAKAEVELVSLDSPGKRIECEAFEVVARDGSVCARFVLEMAPDVLMEFGRLRHLDPDHASIRSLEKPMQAMYAEFCLPEEDAAEIAAGDYILLPELDVSKGVWIDRIEDDKFVRIVAPKAFAIKFSELADGAMPEVPSSSSVEMMVGAKVFARGRMDVLGIVPAFVVEEVA